MKLFIKAVKNIVPLSVKGKVKGSIHQDKKWLKYENIEQRRVFVFLAGFYQNIGDMAITYAQIRFLQSIYPDDTVIAVPSEDTFSAIHMIKRYIRQDDLITLAGGGNMSDQYFHLEIARREVVRCFPDNYIVSFPQTAYFTDSKRGKKELSISRRVYSRHPHLQLFARETDSYLRMCQYFPSCRISKAPDIVLSLNMMEPQAERKGVLVCLRNDKEQALSEDFKRQLLALLGCIFPEVEITDTTAVELQDCMLNTYEATLERFWMKVKTSRVVLTDRLHCMIFCVITGTPCIALDNANHKILGVYETWLKKSRLVTIVDTQDVNRIITAMQDAEGVGQYTSEDIKWDMAFMPLLEACRR